MPGDKRPRRPQGMGPTEMLAWMMSQTAVEGDCRPWTGRLDETGYPGVHWNGRPTPVHRLVWALSEGIDYLEIPPKHAIIRTCGRRDCIALPHMRLIRKGRHLPSVARYRAKLTPSIVRDIRRRISEGETQRALATEYGVSNTAIWMIVSGRSWSDVRV